MINVKHRLNRVEKKIRSGIPPRQYTIAELLMRIGESCLNAHPHWRTATQEDLPPEEYAEAQYTIALASGDREKKDYWQPKRLPRPHVEFDAVLDRLRRHAGRTR